MATKQVGEKRARRREQIAAIAAKAFAAKGYHGATLEDIAWQMDVTRASLYYHISGKEELLREICDSAMRKALEESRAILSSNLSPPEKLREYVRSKVVTSAENQDVCAVIFEQTSALDAATLNKLRRQKREFDQVLIDIIEEGVETGDFRIDDVRMASFTILGACFWVYHWYRSEGHRTPDEIADEIIKLLERGYLRTSQREVRQ